VDDAVSFLPHAFEAVVEPHNLGTMQYTVVFLPPDIAAVLPFAAHPRLRISGEVGDVPFEGAWQPVRGRWYLMLSKQLLRDARLRIGDRAEVRFRVEPQEAVACPAELAAALAADPVAKDAYDALSAGKRRALLHLVDTPKGAAVRAQRVRAALIALNDPSGFEVPGSPRSRYTTAGALK
jgi:Bacteriocin-protection, YdeI or OmpD-Associated/Domain of unknown function (DUF1905)